MKKSRRKYRDLEGRVEDGGEEEGDGEEGEGDEYEAEKDDGEYIPKPSEVQGRDG